ncbi:phosphonate ABC transporter, permease protein PhnE [Allostella sp. ATCC 35155]|nr:phosphonate ABC transporter, permease protein PhnE [Stella sp. ATCC 35155]
MSRTVPRLPDATLAPLSRAYAEAMAGRRRQTLLGGVILVLAVLVAALTAEVDLAKFAANFDRLPAYVSRLFVFDTGPATGHSVFSDPAEWYWGLARWGRLLAETLLIAYLGTVVGAMAAFMLSFLAARNVGRWPVARFLAKRFLEFCRTVPEIVFALIFVVAFGLGPLPGVLALSIHTLGALGKLFAEVVENADMGPVEGAAATGASWVSTMRFAVVPQVLSNFASYALLRFEINVRGASVMGFVGAGGIGQDLIEAIRKFYYADVSAILLLIILAVVVIDMATERLRHRLIGLEHRA